MKSKLLEVYLVPIIISLVLFVVILALSVERSSINIVLMLLGAFLGTFALDIDYFIYAYFFEPATEFSKHLRAYTKDKDLLGALKFIHHHKHDIRDKILNSVLFQFTLAGLTLFIVSSNSGMFIKSFVVSIFVNSLYRMAEAFFENRLDEWFWALKNKPNKQSFYIYTCCLLAVLLYTLSLF